MVADMLEGGKGGGGKGGGGEKTGDASEEEEEEEEQCNDENGVFGEEQDKIELLGWNPEELSKCNLFFIFFASFDIFRAFFSRPE